MNASEKISRRLREAYDSGRHGNAVYIEVDGERVTLAEAARRKGLTERCLYQRWYAGDRGERLLRPQQTRYQRPDGYRVGIALSDWEIVLDHARRVSVKAAAVRFEIPYGAITAMLRGEWERVA